MTAYSMFARCPTCGGIDAQPHPLNPTTVMACETCETEFPVDASAIKPPGFPEAVRAAARALFDDNALWINFADNPMARALGGPREAQYLAAEIAVEAAARELLGVRQ